MPATTVDDITVHFAVNGPTDAPPLVFSNSLGTDLRTWDAVVARLSGRFRCIRYDTRGHGLTDRGSAEVTIPRLAADLVGLLTHLDIRKTLICGLSIGGLIAQQVAKDDPDRVRALVLCDTAARLLPGGRELPVGAITALVGGPLFLALLRRQHARVFAP